MSPTPVERFDRTRTNHLPDVHRLDARQQVLWVLAAARVGSNICALAPAQIAEILGENCGIAISRQRVRGILEREKLGHTVVASRLDGRPYFKIMRRGEDELLGPGTKPLFVDPAKALSSIRAVEEVLHSLEGQIRVCDTFVDSRTLDYLAQIERAESIKLLTENIQDSNRFKRDLGAFVKERSTPIEVRVSAQGQLHDRYLLHSNGMLLVGASLKDIAKKQSVIVALQDSFACEIVRAFDRHWSGATKLQ